MCKILLIHPALGAMIDTGSSLQRASQLVSSCLCGPEHIASLGMTPCCFGTVSLGPCWQPPSHIAPAASSPEAASRAASHSSSSHVMLFIQPHLLPNPKVSQPDSMQSLQWDLNQVRQSQHIPKPIWQLRKQEGQLHLPRQNGNRAFRNLTGCTRRRETYNPSKVQICSERSLPSLQPKGKQISNLCHLWRRRPSNSYAH